MSEYFDEEMLALTETYVELAAALATMSSSNSKLTGSVANGEEKTVVSLNLVSYLQLDSYGN